MIEAAVHDALATLAEIDATIITLRDLSIPPHNFADIAMALSITEGTARTRHLRALKKLQRILAQDHRVACVLRRTTPGVAK
jgi:DNA-directed RNA polymerase specialized sigma24 family protein